MRSSLSLFATVLTAALALTTSRAFADARYVEVPGGPFRSEISQEDGTGNVNVAPFRMRTRLVTNAEFLAFVQREPQWRRDRIAPLYAGSGYLSQWAGPQTPGTQAGPGQPVTKVSWFAARAFCESEHARLPDWIEWEYASAADAQHRDARVDVVRQARILATVTAGFTTPTVTGAHERPNAYGMYGMHSLVGEWVDDYAALFVNSDARSNDDSQQLRLCGGSALAFSDRGDYALMMRVALLSSLAPTDSSNVGFRCVKDSGTGEHS